MPPLIRIAGLLCVTALTAAMLTAQPGTVSTMLGAIPEGEGLPAVRAPLYFPSSLAIDSQGRLLVHEFYRVRRIEPDGKLSTLIGNGGIVFANLDSTRDFTVRAGDPFWSDRVAAGPGEVIYLATVGDFACASGTLDGALIYRLTPPETLRLIFGTSPCDGRNQNEGVTATQAHTRFINDLVVDRDGRIYFADPRLNRVRRIDADGLVRTVAGTGNASADGDGGPAVNASLRGPLAITVSPAGELYIADSGNGRIRKVDAAGVISTFALMEVVTLLRWEAGGTLLASGGRVIRRYASNGESFQELYDASRTSRGLIRRIEPGPDGSVIVAHDYQVVRLNPDGSEAGLIAGVPGDAGSAGPPQFTRAVFPTKTAFDSKGNLWFADRVGLRRVNDTGVTETLTAQPVSFAISKEDRVLILNNDSIDELDGVNRPRLIAADKLNSRDLTDLVYNSAGDLFVADRQNHRVLRIRADGEPVVFAGTGRAGNTGDGGRATAADLNQPEALAVGPDDSLYVAGRAAIRRITPDGTISTIIGGVRNCLNGPNFDSLTDFGNCRFNSVAVDRRGDLYFTMGDGLRFHSGIQRVRGGSVVRVAGREERGFAGDGGPASSAVFFAPRGLSIAPDGDLVTADSNNHRIRRIQGFSPFTLGATRVSLASTLNGPPQEERVTLASSDGETRRFRIEISYTGRDGWLAVSPSTGEVTRTQIESLRFLADPARLPKGIYTARVIISDPAGSDLIDLPVTLLVSGTPGQLALAQTGFTFIAASGSTAPPPQFLSLRNIGTGSIPFTASVSTLAGGNWLTVTPAAGVIDGANSPRLTMQANPAGLSPGIYFGLVSVNAAVADNAPWSAVVLFQVLAAGQQPAPVVDPAGLIFTSANPQSISLSNARASAINYTLTLSFPDRRTWFTLPANVLSGAIPAGQTARIDIRPDLAGVPPGQYRAQMTVRFLPDNTTRVVELLLVIANTSGGAKDSAGATGCRPARLLPMFQQPGGGFAGVAGWPQLIQVQVVDDCQEALRQGRVRITFTNGDPPLTLSHQSNGIWTGTWAPSRVATRLDLTARAESFDPALAGQQMVTGGLREDNERPLIQPGGIFSEASQLRQAPVAIGSNVILQGARLTRQPSVSANTPLPARLGDLSILVGSRALGLQRTSDGEVRAVLPYSLPDSTVHQVIVQRGAAYSLPEPMLVTGAQPAIFSVTGTGAGQGEVYVATEEGSQLADAARPAFPGEDIVIIATGLGAVNPAVPDGGAGAADPVSNVVSPVTVLVQGREAKVKSAALIPGQPGRYQIVATLPDDVAPDASARVVLTVGEQSVSAPVTICVTRRP